MWEVNVNILLKKKFIKKKLKMLRINQVENVRILDQNKQFIVLKEKLVKIRFEGVTFV